MRKYFYSLVILLLCSITLFAQGISFRAVPSSFNEDESVTLTFSGIDESRFGTNIYLWAWASDTFGGGGDCPTNGTWQNSNEANKLTRQQDGVYTITFVPKNFYALGKPLKSIGFLVKNKDGSVQSHDMNIVVGKYQLSLTSPEENKVHYYPSGTTVNITAQSSVAGTFQLKSNGVVVNEVTNPSTHYSYNYTVSGNASFELKGSLNDVSQTKTFKIFEKPNTISEAKPAWIDQGINYDPNNPSKVGLAILAPKKEFIYVIGSFNNWEENPAYLMKRDTTNPDLFWIEISGLEAQKVYTFQYKTNGGIRVADPYSPIVLSPYDDQWISASVYPNLPKYPEGQKYEVSLIQTGMPKYQWKYNNYTRPHKDNLIVYEILLRDFTQERTWQSTMAKIPYIKGLGVNAIEIMPIMEFEGNDSWGYNTSFHYALDKAYGTVDRFKEFVDECHKNGIVVILDIALNHATQRNPLSRLWNIDPDGDGYGVPSEENPFFNQVATHAYPFFEDFNHTSEYTRYYVKRVVEHWIKEYNIDGLRWDLTKGFTQNCTNNDDCTHQYQQDRVDVMKLYADYQWAVDPSSYVIFEHLGTDEEEKEWANYRLGEGKGVMLWNNLVHPYNQSTMGYKEESNFDRVAYQNHTGFGERRNLAYGESHDEERLMYKNLQYGNSSGAYSVKNLDTALDRMKAFGAVLFPVPGPKMIWQFGELGYEYSINYCADGTIQEKCRTDAKPIAFQLGYDQQQNRKSIYDVWSKIINIRLNNPVFDTNTFKVDSGNELLPRIFIWKNTLPQDQLKNVVIVANFTVTPQTVIPYVPYPGDWYNLLDDTSIHFTSTNMAIQLQPGEFKILGNAKSNALSTKEATATNEMKLKVVDNPVKNGEIKLVYDNAQNSVLYLYDISGKMLQKVGISQNKGEISLPSHQLSSGVYLLQLKSSKGSVVAKAIVK